jgi:hypothetical protein
MLRSSVPPTIALALWCASASAHIELLDPPPRYSMARSGDNKACPCGDGTSNRRCTVEGERSDDNRSERVTALRGGQMLTLRFNEYIGHSGRYRVAFDEEGADLDDFNAHPLEDIPDPVGRDGNTGDGSTWEIPVVVPDTPCENCTLQLIQMMDGNMEDPVLDPVGRSSYYACADITISAAGDDGADAPDDSGCSLGRGTTSTALQAALVAVSGLIMALRSRARRRRAPPPRLGGCSR